MQYATTVAEKVSQSSLSSDRETLIQDVKDHMAELKQNASTRAAIRSSMLDTMLIERMATCTDWDEFAACAKQDIITTIKKSFGSQIANNINIKFLEDQVRGATDRSERCIKKLNGQYIERFCQSSCIKELIEIAANVAVLTIDTSKLRYRPTHLHLKKAHAELTEDRSVSVFADSTDIDDFVDGEDDDQDVPF
jgi:hypothetical protein